MTKTVRITYYGMEGEGSTLKEAKQDAGRKLEAAIRASSDPICITRQNDGMYLFIILHLIAQHYNAS